MKGDENQGPQPRAIQAPTESGLPCSNAPYYPLLEICPLPVAAECPHDIILFAPCPGFLPNQNITQINTSAILYNDESMSLSTNLYPCRSMIPHRASAISYRTPPGASKIMHFSMVPVEDSGPSRGRQICQRGHL